MNFVYEISIDTKIFIKIIEFHYFKHNNNSKISFCSPLRYTFQNNFV